MLPRICKSAGDISDGTILLMSFSEAGVDLRILPQIVGSGFRRLSSDSLSDPDEFEQQ